MKKKELVFALLLLEERVRNKIRLVDILRDDLQDLLNDVCKLGKKVDEGTVK